MVSFSRAEATCVSQILTAQAVQEDIGEVQSSRCGIDEWSRCTVSHSERDVHQVISKQGSTLGLPLSQMRIKNCDIPWIDPRTWMEFILKKGLWPRLAGAPDNNVAGEIWTQFWKTYEKLHPGYQMFGMEDVDFSSTAAFAIHGDEGRTLKKQALMVTSIQSCLGNGFDEKRVARDGADRKLKVNFVSHSYTHRFVTSVIPSYPEAHVRFWSWNFSWGDGTTCHFTQRFVRNWCGGPYNWESVSNSIHCNEGWCTVPCKDGEVLSFIQHYS